MTELTSEELDAVTALFEGLPSAQLVELTWPGELALVRGDILSGAIAMAKRTHQVERERDALRGAVAQLGQHSMSYRDFNGDDYVHCIVCEGRMELEGHRSNCRLQRLFALAEPTGAGGDA